MFKKFLFTLVLSLGFLFNLSFVNYSFATGKSADLSELLPSYLVVQEALAADNFQVAIAGANEMKKGAKTQKEIDQELASFAKSKDISQARESFKKISKFFVKWVDESKPKDVHVVYCSMAGAKWVQKKGEVANPYYGKEMLTCGEVQ